MIKALDLFVKAIGLLPVLIPVVALVQAAQAEDSDGGAKFTAKEAVSITIEALSKVGNAIVAMLPEKPAATVRKVLALLPVIGEVVVEIEEATDPASPGGKKLTPVEIAQIAAFGAEKIGKAIADLFRA